MVKSLILATLLFFGLSAMPAVAADAGSDSSQAEKPKDKAPEGSAEGAKKEEKKKDGDKKGGDDPSCDN